MRTYSGFILFEDMLDYLPQTNPALYNFAYNLTHPSVKMISENCGTTNGSLTTIAYDMEGQIELATGLPITEDRILYLVGLGIYRLAVRTLDTCTALGGICRACYQGTFLDQVPPAMGTTIKIIPEYNYQTDVYRGTGGTGIFTLTEIPANYTKAIVITNGNIMSTSNYTIVGTTLTLNFVLALGVNIVIKFYTITSESYIGYVANTYSGSLLGMKYLPTQPIHIRPSLLTSNISDTEINLAKDELDKSYPAITPLYINYIDSIGDKLEKSIYMAVLYGLYVNVT